MTKYKLLAIDIYEWCKKHDLWGDNTIYFDGKAWSNSKTWRGENGTVKEGSEPCWLFIKVDASANIDTYLSYAVNTSVWAPVPGHAGYWYCKVDASSADVQHFILADNQVMVNESVTKADMDAIADGTNYPYLQFMAAAVQEAHIADVTAAWNALDKAFTGAA